MKVDIAKAYDRVDWSFLSNILIAFGFDNKVVGLIHQLISTSSIVVLVNGSSSHFFNPSRGLRQGDPLSPILFFIMADCLERYIGDLVHKGVIKGLQPSSQPLICSHGQFVDDTFFMGKSEVKEARNLKQAINLYSSASGQLVKWNKSVVYFLNTPILRQHKIAKILGCSIGSLPSSYLGLPLGLKAPDSFWEDLINKFSKKLASWKGNLLSQAGKLTLLKASLQSIPTYALSLFKIPSKYAEAIDKIQRNFLWTGTEEKKRMPLIAWDQVCKPVREGGLGIRKITSMNKALLAKQGWCVFHENKEWSTIWNHKYLLNSDSLSDFISSSDVFHPSSIWGAVQETKKILGEGCSWKIGNGFKVRFWEDVWLKDHPLIEDVQDMTQVDLCKQRYGTLVSHY